jgi:hypothetical protein
MNGEPNYKSLPIQQRIVISLCHSITVSLGLPIYLLTQSYLIFILCPTICYLISRYHRRNGNSWMAYQGLQSTIINLTLFFGIFALFEFQPTAQILNLLLLSAIFTLSVYSLWGALDTLLGFEFNYVFIGNISKKVSNSNLYRKRFKDKYSNEK